MKELFGNYTSIPTQLGLKSDDFLFISSDVYAMAKVCKTQQTPFQVDAFIDAFQQELNEGTIVIPAYTDLLQDGDVFDYSKSKPTTGAVSNKVMKRKDFVRSKDPLHSVFSWGKYQSEISKLEDESTFGKNSIFAFLHQNKGKMLIIDVDLQDSFTFVHYVEEQLQVNYRRYYTLEIIRKIAGEEEKLKVQFHTKKPGILTDLDALQHTFIQEQVIEVYNWGNIPIFIIDLEKAYSSIEKFLQSGGKLHRFELTFYIKCIAKKFVRFWNRK
jgi:aminoglycoside 3-N-acetyltransferase